MMVYECEPDYIPSVGDSVYLTTNGKILPIIPGAKNKYFGSVYNIYKQNDKFFVEFNEKNI